jgi:hypothetical protein
LLSLSSFDSLALPMAASRGVKLGGTLATIANATFWFATTARTE